MVVDPIIQAYAVRTATLGSQARVLTVQLMGGGAEGDDATAENIGGAEVLQPMGLFVRPFITPRTEAFGIELGDEVVVFAMLDKSGGGGASAVPFSDVDQGETRLYGAKEAAARLRLRADGSLDLEVKAAMPLRITQPSGAKFWINADGSLDLEAKASMPLRITHPSGAKFWINADGSIDVLSAPGTPVNVAAGGAGDVVLNGGTLKTARVTDPILVGTVAGLAGPFPVMFTFQPFDANGAPFGPPVVSPAVPLVGVVANVGGALRTKA